MHYVTPDLCDAYPELVQVVEPMFSNFGGRDSFGGEIVTIKCFEDNSLVKEQVDKDGKGKVLVVDGGGSLRRALLDPTDHRPWLDVAAAREKQGALAGALDALSRARSLDGPAEALRSTSFDRVRMQLN